MEKAQARTGGFFFDSIYGPRLTIALDNGVRKDVFIHKGHKSVKGIARKPCIHAGASRNSLNSFIKELRAFFDRKSKKASARSTYRAFEQAMHNVIHKDCGQFSGTRLRARRAVNTSRTEIPATAPVHCRRLAAADLSV